MLSVGPTKFTKKLIFCKDVPVIGDHTIFCSVFESSFSLSLSFRLIPQCWEITASMVSSMEVVGGRICLDVEGPAATLLWLGATL